MSKPQDIPTHSSPPSHTVLVVEDDLAVRELVCSILRMHGYEVLDAGLGSEGLRICQQHEGPIHLLLTDVLMPEMNGPELVRKVAMLRPHTRVLYMSGYADVEMFTRVDPETAIPFIQKPFLPDALARKAREVLDAPS